MKEIVLFFFTPPGLGLWPSLLALFYWRRNPKLAWGWLFLGVVAGWIFSTPVMGRILSTTIIAQIQGPSLEKPTDADLIVVLAGGIKYVGKMGGWMPTQASYQRAMVAYEVQSKVGSRTPILISGGKTQGPRYPSEARVIGDLLDRHRAQITPTILEENSLNTYENALESARIIRERGARHILLVTSELHMLRALAAFRGRGINPVPIPVFTLSRGPISWSDFLPTLSGAKLNRDALYEIMGITEYVFSGYVRLADVFYNDSLNQK